MSAVPHSPNARSADPTGAPQLRTILLTDLCDSTALVERLGDAAAAELFRAHDTAFEYRSERFDRHLNLNGLSEREVEERWLREEGGVDAFTDRITLADAVKVAAYAPAPSAYGSYYGFAPTE